MIRTLLPIALLACAAPGVLAQATKVGDGGGFGTYKPTRAGDGGGYTNYAAQQQANAAAASAAYGNAPATPTGGPAAATGGGPSRPTGPLTVFSSEDRRPPALSWRERVKLARRTLVQAGTEAIEAAAMGDDAVEAFAALSLDNDGVVSLPFRALVHSLDESGERQVAQGAAHLLARRGDEAALQALVNHVRDRGPVDDVAARLLLETGRRVGRSVFFTRASNARAGNPADILAIKALGIFPGDDITVLLRRLSGDWSETVQAAAKEALARREPLGYNTRGAYRPPPVGKRPEAVAALPGTYEYQRMLKEAEARKRTFTADQGSASDKEIQAILEDVAASRSTGAASAKAASP